MMSGTSVDSSIIPDIQWGDKLMAFTDINNLPNVVQVTKGQYRNIGRGRGQCSDLYLHSVSVSSKVLAHSVKLKEGKRAVISDQKYSLPFTYQGWFEVLSEDGKSIRGMQSVSELVRLFPSSCLVRDNIKAYVSRAESSDVTVLDGMRTVHSGEQMTLVGEMNLMVSFGKSTNKRRLLRCLDTNGDNVYFLVEQKGLFSPIAGQTNISGVHNIRGLLEKFRLPLMVRLVHGIIPSKLEKNFSGVFRLTSVYSDETAFVLPLINDGKMLPISTREQLQVVVANNLESVQDSDGFRIVEQRCSKMIASYQNSIHVLYSMPEPEVLIRGRAEASKHLMSVPGVGGSSATNLPKQEEDILFLEVEDIYHYVRDGGPVPPPRPRPPPPELTPPSVTSKQSARKSLKAFSSRVMGTVNTADDVEEGVPVTEFIESKDRGAAAAAAAAGEDWEEPIYEPLDKIQQRRRLQEDNTAELNMLVVPIDKPVENLRQVIKNSQQPNVAAVVQPPGNHHHQQQQQQQHQQQHQRDAGGEDVGAPPVPPKHYSLAETEAGLDVSDTNSSLLTGPGSQRGAAVAAVGWEGGMARAVSRHPPKLQHPPYVAVARVGGVHPSSHDDRHPLRSKQKLQGMYL